MARTTAASRRACGNTAPGEQSVYESLIGTTLSARIVEETKVGDYAPIVPEMSGRAFVTGRHEFVIERDDPLRDGFLLGAALRPAGSRAGSRRSARERGGIEEDGPLGP